MNFSRGLLALAVVLAGCSQPREPVPVTPASEVAGAAVVRRPVPETAPPPSVASIQPILPATPPPAPVVVPPGAIYVCVSDNAGVRQQTAIEFVPKVGALCA